MEIYTATLFGINILDPILARLMHVHTILRIHCD